MKKIYLFIVLLFTCLFFMSRSMTANALTSQITTEFVYDLDAYFNFFDVNEDTSYEYNLTNSMEKFVEKFDYESYPTVTFSNKLCDLSEGDDEIEADGIVYYLNFSVDYDSSSDLINICVFMAKDSNFDEDENDFSKKDIIYEGTYCPSNSRLNTTYHHFGIFVPYYTNEEDNEFISRGPYGRSYYCPSDYYDEIDLMVGNIYETILSCIWAREYELCSTFDEDKDYYYLVNYNNLVSLDEIKSNITVSDLTYGDLSNEIRILYSEYDGESRQNCGEYTVLFGVNDIVFNSTYIKIIVRICDIDSPTIVKAKSSIDVGMYKGSLTNDDVLACLDITDNDQITDVDIDLSNYTANKATIGTYSVSITAYDDDDNSTTTTLDVNVVDNVAPTLTFNTSSGKGYVFASTQDALSMDYLYSLATVTDNYDENPTLTITGADDIDFSNLKSSFYCLTYIAADSSGNVTKETVLLNIWDYDYPTFDISGLTTVITLDSGLKLSKDDILLVLSSSLDSTKTVAKIESSYFSDDYPAGNYLFTVMYTDNTQDTFTIGFVESDEASYEKTDDSGSTNNTIWVIVGASICAVALLASCYFIYKRLKKNY